MQDNYTIDLPQMALKALSENWLFKELGNMHWRMLCKGLHTSSSDLKNESGARLLATFTRVKILCSHSLWAFKENDSAIMEGKIQRFGNNMYFSKVNFKTNSTQIEAELMTKFSIQTTTDNTKLSNGKPKVEKNEVSKLSKLPKFGHEFRMVKKGGMSALNQENVSFNIADNFITEMEYKLNPYYDFNGAGLLYFASYPIINDICEARFFNQKNEGERWELNYSTSFKDVFYYANCNIEDTIIYQLVEWEQIKEDKIKTCSILRRKSDGEKIARIFSIKTKIK